MRVTASHIVDWVNTHAKEAQNFLPRLIRRLCFDPVATRHLSFPAGDSTYMPGWDGVLSCVKGNAWVPTGESRWEVGCDQYPEKKASREYRKRTRNTADEERAVCTFVFVTPRRWQKKNKWVAANRGDGKWADVRAYAADDLEQWLEQSPVVALQFAAELGLSGWGVSSLSGYWESWSRQCKPVISQDALFVDRHNVRDALGEKVRTAISQSKESGQLVIRADSVEEATAFTVASLVASPDLHGQGLVVTEPQGWKYVTANPQLRIAIAARTEVAANAVVRDGLFVIVPHATGDLVAQPEGRELILERPNIYEFVKALTSIGMEEADANRYALSTGRSWTVFRRQMAVNPAIRRPAWLDAPQSGSLTLLCLLGAWYAAKEADRQVIERLAGRPYEEIEQDLRFLANLDDAPLLCIGTVWKAKSPLELLSQFGSRITSDQLDRFFAIAREMLAAPDPQLELPDEERYMAQIYGKVHPYSGLLFKSVCDGLVKLAVRGPEQQGLASLHIEERVAVLVRDLLDGADGCRWLSLASYLPTLAEAAPDAFLTAVERSLRLPDTPVTRLITETGDASGFGGRCWHAGLLWALEILAWAPSRLARVSLILARLSHVPVKGNWGNTPSRSLLGFFRTWLPQTAASMQERIQVLDLLIERDNDAVFDLLIGLVSIRSRMATSALRPKWREDDVGAGNGVTKHEHFEMVAVAKEKLLQLAEENAFRLASLLRDFVFQGSDELPRALGLLEPFACATVKDEDRELLRAALRKIIHWHRNYDDAPVDELEAWLKPVEECYERLVPSDLIVRYRWLFDNTWVELPVRNRDKDFDESGNLVAQQRAAALVEIFEAQGIAGVEKLIAACSDPYIVGATLPGVDCVDTSWPEWIAAKGGEFEAGAQMTLCVAGILGALNPPLLGECQQAVIDIGMQNGWDNDKIARFLSLVPIGRHVWELAEKCGPEISTAYWRVVRPHICRNDGDLEFVVERFLEVKRPRTALNYCKFALSKVATKQLFEALQSYSFGEETTGPHLDSWHLAEMLKRLEESGEIERMALVQLEFGLFPVLGYGHEDRAAVLYESIMSEPALFVELICLLYKPEHGEREEEPSDAIRAAAERAWDVLHACKRLPGTRVDGSIDADKFNQFFEEAQALCCQADRATMCDQTLGQILAHSPADADETWPCIAVRELLDRPELEEMREGFCTGVWNKRGTTTRSPWDGGNQERKLADYFRDQAEKMQNSHPNVAAMLESIAKSYERDGKSEDNEANLRKESF
ncbi:MAG: hypothetical protein OEV73_07915 [Desulfobulbaceae bacterium]|nr:hypothetical protein [Desulfobulbaceae bacterium]